MNVLKVILISNTLIFHSEVWTQPVRRKEKFQRCSKKARNGCNETETDTKSEIPVRSEEIITREALLLVDDPDK